MTTGRQENASQFDAVKDSLGPKKIIFVVDIRGWAFDNVATAMSRRLGPWADSCEVVYWEDFNDPNKLVKHLNGQKPDLIHFFFREHLDLILKTVAGKGGPFTSFCGHAVTTHVPDYLYSSAFELAARTRLFDFIDGYFTTCRDLFELYSNDPLISNPDDVIFDWPALDVMPAMPEKGADDTLKVVWSGNSKWGEYAGYTDYKGLDGVIMPAIEIAKARFPKIEFICCDSAQEKIPHAEILSLLETADVLLIASENEGTPLTLIEAMSRGCAIVTTRVGIAEEVLPEIQTPYICDRNASAFADALVDICTHREKLKTIQRANFVAYSQQFGSDSPLLKKWISFLNKAYQNHKKKGLTNKLLLARNLNGSLARRLAVMGLRSGVRIARRYGLIDSLYRISPRFSAIYNRVLHGGSQSGKPDYERIGSAYSTQLDNCDPNMPLFVYAPMWKGVAASTEALFPKATLRFPYFDSEYPEVEKHPYLETLADLLASKALPIVYSGGSLLHLSLAKRLHALNPTIKQFFLWHGSPAQWVERGHTDHFQLWHKAYLAETIQGVITVKPGLHESLRKIGIASWDIYNPIPDLKSRIKINQRLDDEIHIGLFSAINSWYKNPFVQLLAVAGRNTVVLNTNIAEDDIRGINLNIKEIRHHHHMPRPNFLQMISEQDINLYVTNTECSPMIALESWAAGIPCIVGPAGDVYSDVSIRLGELLVEPRVDDPTAISSRIDLVLANRAEIRALLEEYRDSYNDLFRVKMASLLHELRVSSDSQA